MATNGRQNFYMTADGGWIIPKDSKIGQEIEEAITKCVDWHGSSDLIPLLHAEGGLGDHRQDREDHAGELEPGKRLGQGAVAPASPLDDAAMGDPGPSAAGAAPGG
eukprot:4771415-Pyramimonas_sp.AAC.1